jgi:hypothetical protein
MKGPNYRMILFILAAGVFPVKLVGQIDPPQPTQRGPELGVPIDQNLHYLLLVGLAFGLYWAFRQIKSQRSRD